MPSDLPRPSASASAARGGKKSKKIDRRPHGMPKGTDALALAGAGSASMSSGPVSVRLGAPSADQQSRSHARQQSGQSLKLDLQGLDLGGDAGPSSRPLGGEGDAFAAQSSSASPTSTFDAHLRSQSGGLHPFARSPHLSGAPFMHRSSSEDMISRGAPPNAAITAGAIPEDSFALHLRSECVDFNEILSSNAVLRAEAGDSADSSSVAYDSALAWQPQQPDNQVLGGFASLGVSDASSDVVAAKQRREPLQPRSRVKNRFDPSPDSSATPSDIEEGSGVFPFEDPTSAAAATAAAARSLCWAYLSPEPADPLKMLDVLSIEEMGLHSVDIGNLDDWDGHLYSADFVCPQTNRYNKIAWSVATSFKRQKKWVVVPESFCAPEMGLSCDDQGFRTVVVSDRLGPSDEIPGLALRSTFARAAFDLGFLRKPSGSFSSTLLLARPDVHRLRFAQHRIRTDSARTSDIDSCPTSPGTISVHSESKILPFYPVLRRSRSRPYIRDHTQTLRRSRSKPYLKTSDSHLGSGIGIGDAADLFAPSLPGEPGAQFQPGEHWPSARPPASPLGSAGSSRSSSGSHTSQSSVGPVTTSYSQASTCGMSEAPVSESVRSKTSVASPASPRTPSSAGLQGQESLFAGHCRSPFEAASSLAVRPMSADDAPPPTFADLGTQQKHNTQQRDQQRFPGFPSEGLVRRSMQVDEEQRCRRTAHSHGMLLPRDVALSRIRTAESVTPGSISARSASTSAAVVNANARSPAVSVPSQSQSQRRDRKIGTWFKRKVGGSQSVSSASSRGLSPPSCPAGDGTRGPAAMVPLSSSAAAAAGPSAPRTNPNRAMALTRKALEQIEALVERPVSPESTIMGSRRGSACVAGQAHADATSSPGKGTAAVSRESHELADGPAGRSQKAQAPPADVHGVSMSLPANSASGSERLSMMQSRAAVNASLARIYGWTDDAQGNSLDTTRSADAGALSLASATTIAKVPRRLEARPPRPRNTDDENALLGLDRVSADALTMLVPLPLIGRPANMPASRYMRISFTPFGDPSPHSECGSAGSAAFGLDSGSTDRELAANPIGARALPTGTSNGSGTGHRQQQHGQGEPRSGHSSSWYRRLGFNSSSRHSTSFAPSSNRHGAAKDAAAATIAASQPPVRKPARSRTTSNIESFRIAGQVLDAPDVDHSNSLVDPRIPRAGSFPVVLGFCDGRRGLELVQEGFEALGLVGGPEVHAVQGSGDCPPLAGVTDMIIAACAAIIDI